MKKIGLFVLFLMFGAWGFAQDLQNKSNPSQGSLAASEQILAVAEETYDFGKIPQGKPVHHNFEISNIGKSALKLANVHASCGCTTPEWEKDKEIKPGEKSNIKVGYNAASEGRFSKTITITYNENQSKVITITGEVWKTPAASAPSNAAVNDLKD